MKKYTKAGLLIFTLVIPALIFTFLRFFAKNHYDIPYFHPMLDKQGRVELVKGDTVFYQVKDIFGSDSSKKYPGKNIFNDKLTIINYLPNECLDSCQRLQNELERFYELRDVIGSLNILTISDSNSSKVNVGRLPQREGWSIVRLSGNELEQVLFEKLRFQTKIPKAKTNSTESKLVLIDKNEHIRGYYNGYDPEEITRLMAEIKILDFEEKEGTSK